MIATAVVVVHIVNRDGALSNIKAMNGRFLSSSTSSSRIVVTILYLSLSLPLFTVTDPKRVPITEPPYGRGNETSIYLMVKFGDT